MKIEKAWDTRQTWRDGKTQRLEDVLNSSSKAWYSVAQLYKERDARLEKQRLQWENEREQREEEEEKIRQWDEWMAAWKRTQDVRSFAAAIRETCAPIESGSKVEGWLTWASQGRS